MVYDEQTRALADTFRAEHAPGDTGLCPLCGMRGCGAYRLAQRVRTAPVTGPDVGVIEAAPIDGDRLCALRQTALAYTRGLVADGADYHVLARSAVRGVARVPGASVETGWLRRRPAGGSTS